MGFKHFIFSLLAGLALILAVHAQDQPAGFISIACGLLANANFTEKDTGINYIPDATFIDSGVSNSLSTELIRSTVKQYVWNLRSFPQGIRNCYTISVTAGTKYLIRASFLYGNYDRKGILPEFALYLGPNKWDTVVVENSSYSVIKELIHVPSRDYIHVCLVNTGFGTPFISAIELRPLINTTYVTKSGSLALVYRIDIFGERDVGYRYPDDVHDRYWQPYSEIGWTNLSTPLTIDSQNNDYQPPSIVMNTSATPVDNSTPLKFNWDSDNATFSEYYVYMYFAELVKLQPNQSRSFNITLNGKYWYGPIAPHYLSSNTVSSPSAISGEAKYDFSFIKTENSTLPPFINAIEIYSVKNLSESAETDLRDVDAITKIKSTYGIKRNWQGDPCAPKAYSWERLSCSYDGGTPRITSL